MRVTRSCEVIKGMLTRASPEKRLKSLMLRVWTVAVVVIGSCLGYRRALHHLAPRSKHMQPAPSLTSRAGPSGLGQIRLSLRPPGAALARPVLLRYLTLLPRQPGSPVC